MGQKESRNIIKYKENEVSKLIMNFNNVDKYQMNNLKTIIINAISEIEEVGINNIILRCSNLDVLLMALDILKKSNLRISCQISSELIRFENLTLLNKYTKVEFSILINRILFNEKESVQDINNILDNAKKGNFKIYSLLITVNKLNYMHTINISKKIYEKYNISIILDPIVSIFSNIEYSLTWQQLDNLYREIIDYHRSINRYDAILMANGILPTRLLVEHPCNAYVCKGNSCHSGKKDISRKLILLPNGILLPENEKVNSSLVIGDLSVDKMKTILNNYYMNESHLRFCKIVKKIFLKYVQVCPYRVVPWSRIFIELSISPKLI